MDENKSIDDSFKELPEFTEQDIRVILKLLKGKLETVIGQTLTDTQFLQCVQQRLKHPSTTFRSRIGHVGLVWPFQNILTGRNDPPDGGLPCFGGIRARNIYRFMWSDSFCEIPEYSQIVLHIPHASQNIKDLNKWKVQSMLPLVDYYTDQLFVPSEPNDCIIPLVFDRCRLWCDVERMLNDPLESKGFGIVCSRCGSGQIYEKHKAYLNWQCKVAETLENTRKALLIDCHSFSSQPNALLPDTDKYSNIDICIGNNEDETKPSSHVIATVKKYFEDLGYTVGINSPFSNSKTVETSAHYHSLMIEVNKSLYMDERTCKKNKNFNKVREDICNIYDYLLRVGLKR